MEEEKGKSRKQCCHAVLLLFYVSTLSLALLEGAGLAYIYLNFGSRLTALESVPNVNLPATAGAPAEGSGTLLLCYPHLLLSSFILFILQCNGTSLTLYTALCGWNCRQCPY